MLHIESKESRTKVARRQSDGDPALKPAWIVLQEVAYAIKLPYSIGIGKRPDIEPHGLNGNTKFHGMLPASHQSVVVQLECVPAIEISWFPAHLSQKVRQPPRTTH